MGKHPLWSNFLKAAVPCGDAARVKDAGVELATHQLNKTLIRVARQNVRKMTCFSCEGQTGGTK